MNVNQDLAAGPLTVASGGTTEFPYSFQIATSSEIAVLANGELVDPSNYAVARLDSGAGSVVFIAEPEGGTEILPVSMPSFLQHTEFDRSGPFYPDMMNEPMARIALRDIWLKYQTDRALKVPPGDTPPAMDLTGMVEGETIGMVGGQLVPVSNEPASIAASVVEVAANTAAANASAISANASALGALAAQAAAEDAAADAGASATTAATEALASGTARTAAELARDAALAGATLYADEPTGRAAVADGVFFRAVGAASDKAVDVWRRDSAGASTLIASYPSLSALNAAVVALNAATSSAANIFRYSSIALPRENGENHLGVNGGMYLPSSNNLFKRIVAGDAPVLSTASSVAIIWNLPVHLYDGLRRAPTFVGNVGLNDGVTNRRFSMGYVTRADNGNTANAGKFRAKAIQETGGGSVDVYSALPPADFSYKFVEALRFDDAANFHLDLIDCVTGVVTAGANVAKPGAWAGVSNLTGDIGIGVTKPASYPQSYTSLFGAQNINYARGEFGGFLIIDGATSDAEWQSLALGGDPLTIWPGKVRIWVPGVDALGAINLARQQNLASAVNYSAAAVQLGTLSAGGNIRRQSSATYLFASMPWVSAFGSEAGQDVVPFSLVLSSGGLTADRDIHMRVISKGGTVVRDWQKVGKAAASMTVRGVLPMWTEPLRLEFREPISGTKLCVYSDIFTCEVDHADAQSQVEYALSLRLSVLAGATSPYVCAWEGDAGSRCLVLAEAPSGATLKRPALYLAESNPQILGPGMVSYLNRRARTTKYPVLLMETAISGTTIEDQVSDDTGTDVRDMEDVYKIARLIGNRTPAGKIPVTVNVELPHSSDTQINYVDEVIKPYLWGLPSTYITDIDDFLYSGKELVVTAPYVQLPRNRQISSTATTDPAKVHDTNTHHIPRSEVREGGADVGYFVGPEVDVHTLDGDIFTHPDPDDANGAVFVAEMMAEGAAAALGKGTYKGPVKHGEPYFRDGTRTSFIVPWDGPLGMVLKTKSGGAAVLGREVNASKSGFTESIISPRHTEVFSTGDPFPVDTVTTYKPGGPGDYGVGFDEASWIAGTLVNNGFLVCGTSGDQVVGPA